MRLLWFILSIIVALHSAVDATTGKERRSTLNGTSPTILTPDFIQTVQEIVDAGGVQGLTLAIVNKAGPSEFGAWGIKSENGTKMTTDVSRTFLGSFKCTDESHDMVYLVDTLQSCLLLKGLPHRVSGDRNR